MQILYMKIIFLVIWLKFNSCLNKFPGVLSLLYKYFKQYILGLFTPLVHNNYDYCRQSSPYPAKMR